MFTQIRFNESIQSFLVWILCLVYIKQAPFTKVEESFSMQAIHDFVFLSKPQTFPTTLIQLFRSGFNQTVDSNLPSWDHEFFPGVVHRTFFTPFVVSLLTKSVQFLNLFEDKFVYQIISRVWLSTLFAIVYYRLIGAITKSHGSLVSQWVTWITLSQFHFLFYASRPLPNTFALIFVLMVYSTWLKQEWYRFIALIAFTVLVIRFETILLFGFILLVEVFYTGKLSIYKVLKVGIPSGLVCLAFTILFDSYMWNKWIWPEGDGILFNIIHNKSHEWGTQHFLWYFYSVIPRLLLCSSIFLLAPGFYTNKYFFVGFSFLLAYSFLPHKELRFVIYIVPLLNLCISDVIVKLSQKILNFKTKQNKKNLSQSKLNEVESSDNIRYSLRRRNVTSQVASLSDESKVKQSIPLHDRLFDWLFKCLTRSFDKFLVFHLLLNFVLSLLMLFISSNNYPGGESLITVNRAIKSDVHKLSESSVYVCNLAAQSGFTRFLQLPGVYYNKDPKFVSRKFDTFKLIYLVLEPKNQQLYFNECDFLPNNYSTCQLAANSIAHNYECQWLQNITAFDRIDFKHLRVNFRTFLNVYKCIRVEANR